MIAKNKISFRVEARPDLQAEALTPIIDGVELCQRIKAFEEEKNYKPAGGYGGLVPSFFTYGPLERYFLGEYGQDSYWANVGGIYALGCDCGEVGCWPLTCKIKRSEKTIIWSDFSQVHRPERDYTSFGPFTFDLDEYKKSLQPIAAHFPPRQPLPTISYP